MLTLKWRNVDSTHKQSTEPKMYFLVLLEKKAELLKGNLDLNEQFKTDIQKA